MTRPRVSVIVPCYNLGQYLDEAVDSVFAQSYEDFEIVIVNDGSTDPFTNALLATYERPRTRVFTTENRGLASARNLAIEKADGEYLCALDADDRLDPRFLEKTAAILDSDRSICFVSCWLRTFGEEEWVWKQEQWDFPALLGECTVATPALVRRAAVLDVGGYDDQMTQGHEDWDLWISLVERGYQGTIIPEVLFYYRRRSGSMSTVCTQGETHLALVRYIIGKHRASYRRHVFDLLLRKEAESCELLKAAYAKEQYLETWLQPIVERRRTELERLQRKLEAVERAQEAGRRTEALEREVAEHRRRTEELSARLHEAEREVRELRASKSWKLTAPVRAAYDLVSRLGGRPGPPAE